VIVEVPSRGEEFDGVEAMPAISTMVIARQA
jgi:hypothetical protein